MKDIGKVRHHPLRGRWAAVLLVPLSAGIVQAQSAEDLQRDLDAMKAQLRALEEKTKKQEELIDRLAKEKTAQPVPPPGKPAQEGAAGQPKAGEGQPPEEAPKAVDQEEMEERIKEDILEKIQPSLSAANKTFPSQFNPAIGLIIDTAFSWKQNEGNNFEFRAAELGISASIDPFAKGFAIITGAPDGFEVEEAGIVTTSLPWNLTVKGGRFFADFGRLSKFHDHDLPFVNRPVVLDRFVGGESQADGVEVSWLAPMKQYLTLTLGAYNKIGPDNTRVDNLVPRDLGEFTFLARPATYISLNEANGIDLGASYALTPRVEDFTTVDDVFEPRNGKPRHLAGIDLTYKYSPLSTAQYRGFVWGTELLYNRETWNVGDPADPVFRGRDAWGLYTYGEVRLTRRYYPGFLFDWAEDLSRRVGETTAYSPYFTIWLSEFNRLRLQYTYLDEPGNHESQFFVQWTAILGSHVHGFRDR